MTLRELAIDQIEPHPQRLSRPSGADDFEQLAQSIRVHGVQAPLLVRPLPSNRFQLIAGDRRLRAARSAGLATVPVVIRELDDDTALELVTRGVSRRSARPPQLISRDPDLSGQRREPIVISGSDIAGAGRDERALAENRPHENHPTSHSSGAMVVASGWGRRPPASTRSKGGVT